MLRKYLFLGLLLSMLLLIVGCNGDLASTKLTVTPYELSEQEDVLISKTDIDWIGFFQLDGSLGETDDIQISIEVYENGKFKEELLKTYGAIEQQYNNKVISFAISRNDHESEEMKLIAGIPSGLATTKYSSKMMASSFGNLVGSKITLEKEKEVYLLAWQGSTSGELRTLHSENGELPENLKEAELAFLYKVLLADREVD